MTQSDSGGGHDRNVCRARKHLKQRPGAKTGKNPIYDSDGNELCTRPAGWGTEHPGHGPCKLHGGKTATHVTVAAVAQAAAAVATFGLPREVDPRDALLEEVYRTAGAVDWLQQQVRTLTTDAVIWGRTKTVDRGGEDGGYDVTEEAAVNIWVQLLNRERKHLIEVCKAAVGAGLEERRVRLAEQQGSMLAGVIKAILGDLDLSPEQSAKVATVVPRHLRSVA